MEQAKIPVFKSRPMRPFLYSHLATSTPDSHQISKRIKGLLEHSEHYKGNRVDYPNVGPSFSPLRTRDYRKARELTLEIWDPMVQASFLEKFLKLQRNLHTIRIKVLTEKGHKGEMLKRLCEILSKNSRLNRVHIDFDMRQREQVKSKLMEGMRSLRLLPRLKDLDVTVDGRQVLPFSASLAKVGFDSECPHLAKPALIEKLMKKTPKFHQLDTIKIDCRYFRWFVDGFVFLIPKVPNFRELDFNFYEGFNFPLEQALKILDTLVKAPNFEVIRLGFPLPGKSQISLLKHPLFKAKSLKRTSLSLFFTHNEFATFEDIKQIFDLLEEMPSLYELSLDFYESFKINDEIAEGHMEKISRMASIRKLRIVFNSNTTLLETQARNVLKSIFNMHFLEELDLRFPQDCLGLNRENIEGLPRLKKISLHFSRSRSEFMNNMLTIMEIVGKCHQLRELELKMSKTSDDYQEVTMKLSESLRKLKKLQVLKFNASAARESSNITIDALEDLVINCNQLINLQDLRIDMNSLGIYARMHEAFQRLTDLRQQLSMNKKYRVLL